MMAQIQRTRKFPIFLIGMIFVCTVVLFNWQNVKIVGTSAMRDAMASYQRNVAYKDFLWIYGEDVDVVYKEEDEVFSDFILQLSEESYDILREKYDFTPGVRPLIVIYPTYKDLLDSLGWDESNKASGVYQAGTIKIVSPIQWYPVDVIEDIKEIYKNFGPMHHEMTHLFVDYMANGNYPDWYTEGLAQIEELKLLNIQWIDENNTNPEELYAFDTLRKGFYRIENQALAYRQSLTMVIYLEETYGEEINFNILDGLGKGNSFSTSLTKATGVTWDEFEINYTLWIKENWNKFF